MAWPERHLSLLNEDDIFTLSGMADANQYRLMQIDVYEDEDGNIDDDRVLLKVIRLRDQAIRYLELEVEDVVYIKPIIVYPQRKV